MSLGGVQNADGPCLKGSSGEAGLIPFGKRNLESVSFQFTELLLSSYVCSTAGSSIDGHSKVS